ncbi:ankyrin repeat domain-containing protein [Myroides marinus]|uniref:ankyrin repeat domain-containing protein n=1 Tax=Myroides marinus TaxID=703342 RepID=UPI0025764CB7|nr:ankyrin repeat domain-containing protein [Myroides marinus]
MSKQNQTMIVLKDIGTFQDIPPIVHAIITGDIASLNNNLTTGWDIEKSIVLSKYIEQTPLDFALIMENFDSLKWLVEKGVNLNIKHNPSFLTAVRYCNEHIIQYVVANGAKTNGVNNVKSGAFEQALYGKKYQNLPLIHQLGHTVEKYGGLAFRQAVNDRNYKVLDFFIANNVDINYNKADMVYPFKPTPLCVAARYVDLKMCKYLVEHGADITLAEKDGMRPYSIALEKGDTEMAAYFKSLEPVDFHNLNNKLDELKTYKLPKALLSFLQTDNLHIDLPDSDFEYVEFFSLLDTVPFKIGRQKLLRLSKQTGDYTHIDLVWNPKTKKMACYDMEHQELIELCAFEEFMNNPTVQLDKCFR